LIDCFASEYVVGLLEDSSNILCFLNNNVLLYHCPLNITAFLSVTGFLP
jgi:hypothetical protein